MRFMDKLESFVLNRTIRIILIMLTFGPVACAQEEQVVPTETAEAAETAVLASTATPTALPAATATPMPEPTELVPAISAGNQSLQEDGQLVVSSVTLPQPGWVVIHNLREGQVEEVLGYAAVPAGSSQDVTVTIDPRQANSALVAMLHVDLGETDVFDFPGPDLPWQKDGVAVSVEFSVDVQLALPAITVADQAVGEEGLVQVESVFSPEPGWLLIHADEAGSIGEVVGFAWLPAGHSEGLVFPVRWRESTPRLYAVLYEDRGRPHQLDEAEDLPLLVDGQPVVETFDVSLPPDVFVLDQPVINGQLQIERVISQGASWLVIYYDEEGELGLIIGYAPLADGVNEQVVVDVVESSVTPSLHILLHEDSVAGDEFNFPAADPPLPYEGRQPAPFTFRTDPGNYLITRDQSLATQADGSATVIVPLVVVDAPTWVVIRPVDAEEEVGEIIGMTWLPAGISRDIEIEIDGEQVSDEMRAILHLDAGTPEQFDYPNGPDVPFQYSRNVIRSPFWLLPDLEE